LTHRVDRLLNVPGHDLERNFQDALTARGFLEPSRRGIVEDNALTEDIEGGLAPQALAKLAELLLRPARAVA